MAESRYIVLLITTGSAEEARKVAETLLSKRKAACVNIVPGVSSLFRWEYKLDSSQENLLIVKTKASLLPEVTRLVKEAHRYDVPEIIALPIIGGNQEYLDWIEESVE